MAPQTITNDPVGGDGGQPFELYKPIPVRSINVWVDKAWGEDWRVLKGIQIAWNDDTESDLAGTKSGEEHSFHFKKGEKVKDMEIWGHGRADSIRFSTDNANRFEAGGNGGTRHIQDTGNGTLFGFRGAAQGDVDSLGAIFEA
ncbi:hypothetical protein PENPOL_c002G05481 [Penicillium polonicum]|uniref:Jacalin-type lectin domain-containing protein n=1 Tax=Penicillium polonicum TaxID=60169 RepID=A0A1V6NW99_PENPO|nr:hypothetical protein PENPOL_c002G05481 [Penicillium polonicum]